MNAAVVAHSSVAEHGALAAAGVAVVALYAVSWSRLPGADVRRFAAFALGVAAVLVAVMPAMERVAGRSFSGHMVQHLLLIVVAAPLLVLGRPLRTIAHPTGPISPDGRAHRTMTTVGRRWRRWASVLAPVGFLLVLFTTHLTTIYDRALHDRVLHDAEHVAYLAAAVATWAAVGAAGSARALGRVGVVFGVAAGTALLAMVLMSAGEPLVATYADRLGHDDALADQRIAASIMWVGGMASTLPLLVLAFWRWAATEERVAQRAEALADHRPTGVG